MATGCAGLILGAIIWLICDAMDKRERRKREERWRQ